MLAVDTIRSLFGYHYWANGRILLKAQELSAEDYFENQEIGHGSLHDTIFHTFRHDVLWGTIIRTKKSPTPNELPVPNQFPDLSTIKEGWAKEEVEMLRYLDRLTINKMNAIINLHDPRNPADQSPLHVWRALHQIIMHGMQHRSEAAQLLTFYGASPGDLDYLFYAL